MIIEKTLNSSALDGFSYNTDTKDLTIVFKGNRAYLYPDVPRDVVDALARAESAGKYFNSVIKHYARP